MSTMSLVTTVRCFNCPAEQTVIGPSTYPTFGQEGWMMDLNQLYRPNGRHFCPRHKRVVWDAFCDRIMHCGCIRGGRLVDAPASLTEEEVLAEISRLGVRCGGGNAVFGLELVPDVVYRDVQSLVDVRLG